MDGAGLTLDNARSALIELVLDGPAGGKFRQGVDGERVDWKSPRDAQARGISMEYQDLGLFNNLDVAANVFAGRERVRRQGGRHPADEPQQLRSEA